MMRFIEFLGRILRKEVKNLMRREDIKDVKYLPLSFDLSCSFSHSPALGSVLTK